VVALKYYCLYYNTIQTNIMASKLKTTPKEKMIVNLMEEVISILSTCKDLSDPEFSMYETMKHAVDTEVYYPLYDN
tara:strand:- start:526 stop:753 length:228 start_codon:yes stop_codon:yes gene_type:complete